MTQRQPHGFHEPIQQNRPAVHVRHAGVSLLEVAIALMMISVVVAPMINSVGGTGSGQGTAARLIGQQTKEILLANTMVEEVLANNFTDLNCGTGSNDLPDVGEVMDYPRCQKSGNPYYYKWRVYNNSASDIHLPQGNFYYTATVQVFKTATDATPDLILPVSFYQRPPYDAKDDTKTAIMIVLDRSGSMRFSGPGTNDDDTGGVNGYVGSPFLKYRYEQPATPHLRAYSPDNTYKLDLFNDAQLDIVTASPRNIPGTPWDERYITEGVLKAPNCRTEASIKTFANNRANYGYFADDVTDKWNGVSGDKRVEVIKNICSRSPNYLQTSFSRMEAARSALLQFIVKVERDADVRPNTSMGLITFSSHWPLDDTGWDIQAPISEANDDPGHPKHYAHLRRAASWVNRDDGRGDISGSAVRYSLIPGGSTMTYNAVEEAAKEIFKVPKVTNRIIFLISDGQPTDGKTHRQFRDLALRIGNGDFDKPGTGNLDPGDKDKGKTATIMTLGMIDDPDTMTPVLKDDLAENTPGGQFFWAANVADVSPVFDQIYYQIQRTILLVKAQRYNVKFNQ